MIFDLNYDAFVFFSSWKYLIKIVPGTHIECMGDGMVCLRKCNAINEIEQYFYISQWVNILSQIDCVARDNDKHAFFTLV